MRFLLLLLVAIAAFALGYGVGFFSFFAFPQVTQQALECPICPTTSPTALEEITSQEVLSATIRVLAVRGDTGQGAVGYLTAEIRPGKGRVLLNTNPFVEPDTQYSGEIAVHVAQQLARKNLGDRDVIFSFTQPESRLIGGQSAGAAMTIATLAALERRQLRADVAISGTIDESGRLGLVGGVIEKAEAAAKDGVKIFLVPKGLEQLRYYEQQVTRETRGPFVIERVTYVPRQLDLNSYTMSQWGMETRAVATIDEAMKYFF